MSTVQWVPCITEDAEMHAGWRRRHAWQNTGLDIIADDLVRTRRCVWCDLRQHAPTWTRTTSWKVTPDNGVVVLEDEGHGDTRLAIAGRRGTRASQ